LLLWQYNVLREEFWVTLRLVKPLFCKFNVWIAVLPEKSSIPIVGIDILIVVTLEKASKPVTSVIFELKMVNVPVYDEASPHCINPSLLVSIVGEWANKVVNNSLSGILMAPQVSNLIIGRWLDMVVGVVGAVWKGP